MSAETLSLNELISEEVILIDTNVFLIDPNAYIKFPGKTLVIPLIVIEELDSFKREMSSIGKAARDFIHTIDKFRSTGKITEGVPLPNGSTFQVYILENYENLPEGLDHAIKDNYILSAAMQVRARTGRTTALVTKDADLRIKADVLGIAAWDYNEDGFSGEALFSGEQTIETTDEWIDRFFRGEPLSWQMERPEFASGDFKRPLITNEYVTLKSPTKSALARCGSDGRLRPLLERHGMSLHPRNREQRFALDALLDPDIRLVTLAGKAGTGKTLVAIAAGLELVLGEQLYRKLLVARPVVPMGRDLGYLPGELEEKLRPWMQPIFDNLEFLLEGPAKANKDERKHDRKIPGKKEGEKEEEGKDIAGARKSESTIQYLHQAGLLDVEPLTYIRGRSIPHQYVIIDEAQNLSSHEAKTIITRAGEGTKIIFTGDFYQIDHPYLNVYSNGLSFTFNRMRGQDLFAHITLEKGERSELAELASRLMEN